MYVTHYQICKVLSYGGSGASVGRLNDPTGWRAERAEGAGPAELTGVREEYHAAVRHRRRRHGADTTMPFCLIV